MKSSKWIVGLLALVAILAMATSSFAQVQITITNQPSAFEISTNHNAQTSDPSNLGNGITVSGSLLASSNLTATNLVLTFPGPITANGINNLGQGVNVPAGDPVQIVAQAGLFAGVSAISTINFSAGTVTIALPAATGNTASGSFRLVGVRTDVNGKTAPLSITASLSNYANNYLLLNTTTTAINALGAGVASFTQGNISGQTNQGTFLAFTNQTGSTPSAANASVVLTEGSATAWRTAAQSSSYTSAAGDTGFNGTQIRLTVAGIPSGMTVAVTGTGSKGVTFTVANPNLTAPSSSATTSNQAVITFTGTGLTTVDSIQLNLTLSGAPKSALTAGTITASITMAPIGTGVDTTAGANLGAIDTASESAGYPQFAEADLGPVTIGTIAVANTTLLVPYAVVTGAYDTGIAIANTTADPFGPSAGGATSANGTLTFTLYPSNSTRTGAGTPITVTSSSTKIFGQGLDSTGAVDAGVTWTGNVGADILPAAGVSASSGFFGYVFIQANFLDAHGVAFIYNGSGFTSASPVLVVLPPATGSSRNAPSNGAESLNN